MEGKLKEEEYDTENVTVQIVELSTDEIAKSNNWIGANRPVYEGEQSDDEESGSEEEEEEQIPGFTVTSTKPSKKKKLTVETAENSAENGDAEGTVDENNKRKKKFKKIPEEINTKRALGQYFAKRATNTLKHSKAFQMKNRLEGNKKRKKARAEKDKRIKLQNKREKHKKNTARGAKKNKVEKKVKSHRK